MSKNNVYDAVAVDITTLEKNEGEIARLLKYLQGNKEVAEDIGSILRRNRSLLVYKDERQSQYIPLLHIVKYRSKKWPSNKIQTINTIIDVEYETFTFSADKNKQENSLSLFAVAAKADLETLRSVINYFTLDPEPLHNTRHGDTVLSFMIKFGDLTAEKFGECFVLLLKEVRIDYNRVNYYCKTVKDVIEDEITYFKNKKYFQKHLDILNLLMQTLQDNYDTYRHPKHDLFQKLIQCRLDIEDCSKNLVLMDADDGENTLLQLAVVKNKLDIVRILLKFGADPQKVVLTGNTARPLIFAAKLLRQDIFREILKSNRVSLKNDDFITLVSSKYFKILLEWDNLDVNFDCDGKIPLYYAITHSARTAIKSLLKRGSDVPEDCLKIINPKDLEEYFTSCLVADNYATHIEDYCYKMFIVFDFFVKNTPVKKSTFNSELEIVKEISKHKRLKHLLAHPLIQLLMILKWHCLSFYFYIVLIFKLIIYSIIVITIVNEYFHLFIYILFLLIQVLTLMTHISNIQYSDLSRFQFNGRSHIIVESCIVTILVIMILLIYLKNIEYLRQSSAVLVILVSISVLLSLGYHPRLSKWMAMIKKVFATFTTLLILFIFPILAFSIAFHSLLHHNVNDLKIVENDEENNDFDAIPTSFFRVLVMLSGDIGDNKYYSFFSYFLFLLFCIGMVIVLMNFWTGVAVSDIKEIEEQSTVAAYQNVIEYISSLEKVLFILEYYNILVIKSRKAFLKYYTIPTKKYQHGINLYINKEHRLDVDDFKSLDIDEDLINSIKNLKSEESNIANQLLKRIENIEGILRSLNIHEKLVKSS